MTSDPGAEATALPHHELVDEPQSWPVHSSEDIWRGSAPFAVRRDEVSVPGEVGGAACVSVLISWLRRSRRAG